MKALLITVASVAVIAGGVLYAQPREEIQRTAPPNPNEAPNPAEVEEALDKKAKRIPKRGLAAALRARADDRSARAQTVKREPDLAALREDLRQTSAEDQANPQRLQQQPQFDQRALTNARGFTTAPQTPPPPPPGLRPMAASRMQNVDAREVERVRVPVLIPAADEVRNTVKVYGLENAYTATALLSGGASLSISGTCNRVVGGDPDVAAFRKRLAEQAPRLAGANAAYHISRNDFGVDLSFSRFGCGYVMTVECDDPTDDPRCAADDYITGLAQSMILANPELAGGE